MAQPRGHMPHVVHGAVVTVYCADAQANDAHAKIFGIVGAHGLPKRLADAVVAVRTNAYRVVYTEGMWLDRGWRSCPGEYAHTARRVQTCQRHGLSWQS